MADYRDHDGPLGPVYDPGEKMRALVTGSALRMEQRRVALRAAKAQYDRLSDTVKALLEIEFQEAARLGEHYRTYVRPE